MAKEPFAPISDLFAGLLKKRRKSAREALEESKKKKRDENGRFAS